VGHILLAARINQTTRHPLDDAAGLEDLAQEHGAGLTGQSIRPAFDPQGPVEPRRDRL
jgi:hypothetical protein